MTHEFVTLPRGVVEQMIENMKSIVGDSGYDRMLTRESEQILRAALDQPKNHIEQHLGMVPAGWKLVPVEPTDDMHRAAVRTVVHCTGNDDFPPAVYRAMLAAAPQPPAPWCKATKRGDHVVCDDCKSAWDANDKNPPACVPAPPAVEQPQAEQPAMTQIAQRKLDSMLAEGYTISGYSVYHEQKHQHGFVTGAGLVGWWKPEGMEYPQPQGEQEPVAWLKTWDSVGHARTGMKRVDLTPECETWLANMFPVITPLYAGQPPQGEQGPTAEHKLKDVRCECCGYMTHHREHMGCIRVAHTKREPLTDKQIDAIADAMPGGLEGFMKGWGWRQFARAVLEAAHNIK